jgi:hypothetical protein
MPNISANKKKTGEKVQMMPERPATMSVFLHGHPQFFCLYINHGIEVARTLFSKCFTRL